MRLLALALLALAAPASAQVWSVECNSDPSAELRRQTGWPFTRILDAEGCAWARAGGDTVVVTRPQVLALEDDLEAASRWLQGQGFGEPALDGDGVWRVTLFPGDYPCAPTGCDPRDPVYGVYRQIGQGGFLYVGTPYALEPGGRAVTTAYHELLHAYLSAYPAFTAPETTPLPNDCAVPCWIDEGLPEAFGVWWLGSKRPPVGQYLHRRYDLGLVTGRDERADYDVGQQTLAFWLSVAETTNEFDVALALARASRLDVAGVDRALEGLGIRGGLSRAYLRFATTYLSDGTDGFSFLNELRPTPGGPAVDVEIVADPISAHAVVVRFDRPAELGTVRVRVADPAPGVRLLYEGEEIFDGEIAVSTADACPESGECEVAVRVVNVADVAARSELEVVRVEAALEAGGCDFKLPEGVTGLRYAMSHATADGSRPRPSFLRLDFGPAPSGGRHTLAGDVRAELQMFRAGEWETTEARVRLRCSSGGLDLSGIVDGFLGPNEADAAVDGTGHPLPPRPEVGLELPDVTSRLTLGLDGVEGVRADARVTGRRVTGRQRLSLGRDPRLQRLQTWVIEGTSSGTMALDAAVLEDQMEQAGADLSDATGQKVREGLRGMIGRFNDRIAAEGGGTPHTVWYSLEYGLVKVESGGGSHGGGATMNLLEVFPAQAE